MRAEWRGRADFHEVAEAVGVPTNAIVAAGAFGKDVLVLYGKTASADWPPVFRVLLRRDEGGILQPVGEPEGVPHFWREFRRRLGE